MATLIGADESSDVNIPARRFTASGVSRSPPSRLPVPERRHNRRAPAEQPGDDHDAVCGQGVDALSRRADRAHWRQAREVRQLRHCFGVISHVLVSHMPPRTRRVMYPTRRPCLLDANLHACWMLISHVWMLISHVLANFQLQGQKQQQWGRLRPRW